MAFIEVEPQEGGVREEIAAKGDGAEINIGCASDILPGVVIFIKFRLDGFDGFKFFGSEGKDRPSDF
jgi:hypothetical protein